MLALVRGDDRLSEAKLARRARRRVAARDRRGDPRRVRRRRRLARPGRLRGRGRSPTRRCARGSSSPARTATAGTCAASRPAATTSRASPTSASRARATAAPICGGALALPDRDRGRPHLQLRHPLLGAARRDLPRRGRPREAAPRRQLRHRPGPHDGRGDRAAPRRARDRRWPAAIAPYDVHVVALPGVEERGRGGRRARSRRPGATCSSTTATCGRARSSPTPT